MKPSPLFQILVACALAAGPVITDVTNRPATYRAGIVEFKPPTPADTKAGTVLQNAKLYREYAANAAEMGVQILVFSEYGLVTLNDLENRESVAGYLQDVPDPKTQEWNPCYEQDKFNNTQVLQELSCAAKENNMVIVANLLSREPCDTKDLNDASNYSSYCPRDRQFNFNTNVIFAQNGSLIARYHKRHLFTEEDYADPSPQPEYVILDLGFVRMATVICFDLMFPRPLIELIEKHGIRNIAYPTAWVNELPFFTAPQAFSAVAYGLGINILAANYYKPQSGYLGSGIFSSTRGVLNGTWDISTRGRLVIADVPVEPANATSEDDSLTCDIRKHSEEDLTTEAISDPSFILTDKPSMRRVNKTHRIMYEPLSNYTYVTLEGMQGNITQLCQGSLCCNLTFKFVTRDINDTYKFVVRSGIRTLMGDYKLGVQICSVLRCEDPDDIESCGRVPDPSHTPETSFDKLVITGRFETKYLFPNIFSTKLGLVNTHRWKLVKHDCQEDEDSQKRSYTIGKFNITTAIERSILEASIIGRVYEWDGK